MKIYRFKWFDEGRWFWFEGQVMANNQSEAEQLLRSAVEIGFKPYQKEKVDSLELLETFDIDAGVVGTSFKRCYD